MEIKQFKINLLQELDRNNLVKYWIRKKVYNLAMETFKFSNWKQFQTFETRFEELKFYLSQFGDLKIKLSSLVEIRKGEEKEDSQFFPGIFKYISGFFSNNETVNAHNEDSSRIIKILMKGPILSGKTSFLKCCVLKRPVDRFIRNSILPDFGLVEREIGNSRLKTQLWDEHRYNNPTEYSNQVFAVLLFIDPFMVKDENQLNEIIEPVLKNLSSIAEVILIQTKKDLEPKQRNLSELIYERLSFSNFRGGLSLFISNTDIEEPSLILYYCTLLNYLMQSFTNPLPSTFNEQEMTSQATSNVQPIQPTRVASRVGSAKAPTSSSSRSSANHHTTSTANRQPVKSNRIGSTYDKTFHNKVDKLVSDPIRQVTGRKNILAKEGVMPTKTEVENNSVRGTVAKKLGVQPSKNNNQAKVTRPVNGAFGKDQWEIEWDDKEENIIPKLSKPSTNNTSGDISSSNWTERLGRGKCSSICDVHGRPIISIESSSSHWYILTYEEKSFLDIETEDFNINTSIKIQKGNENSLFTIVLDYGINKRCKDEYIAIVMNVAQKYWKIERVENKKVVSVQQAIDKSLAPLKYMDISISLSERKLTLKNDNTEIFTDVILPISSEGSKERRVGLGVMSAKVSIYDWKVFDPKTEEKVEDLPLSERPLPDYIDKHLAEMIKRDLIEFNPNVTWDSIAELHDAKRLLKEAVVLPLLMPDIFAGLRSPWKGVLLFGPPGTGKTMVARAVATEGKTTFFNCSASTLVSKYHGESERLVKTLFQMARLFSPSTVFFDEIDALMMTRGSASEHEASRRLKSEILTQIDGINSQNSRVMVLATTNKPWDLDEAMRRRLEKRIYIPLPDEKTRVSLFNIFLKDQEMESDVSTDSLATLTDGYSGADIHLLCREAALRPLRKELDNKSTEEIMKLKERGELKLSLCMEDFSESVKTMKPSVSQNEIEKYQQWMKEFQSV